VEAAPIQNGANRPADRRRHALVPALLRVIVIAGFAVAGWIALAALNQSASADEPAARPDDIVQKHGIVQKSAFAFHGLASGGAREDGASEKTGASDKTGGPLRSGAALEPRVSLVPDRLRELGDDPVGYLQTQSHEVLDRKERAVRQMGELADAAGVPSVRITGVRPDIPIAGGLVHDIVNDQPVLSSQEPQVQADERPAADETDRSDEAAGEIAGPAGADRSFAAQAASGGDAASYGCADCRVDLDAPGSVPPSGQDNPRGASSGGHLFAPVADLQSTRYPAAPTAVETGTFHRTALTDVSAPGGPSVVPD